jgi:hypothetical protein
MARQAADAVFVPGNELMGMRENEAAMALRTPLLSFLTRALASVFEFRHIANEEILESDFVLPIIICVTPGTASSPQV